MRLGSFADVGGASLQHEHAIVEDIGALRHLKALHHVLFDQQERDALGVDGLDQREQLLDQKRRQAERRLVEDQKPGLGHQAAPDGEHLLLAARQRAGALALPFGKPREDREHPVAVVRAPCAAAPIGAEVEIFAHRHVRERCGGLPARGSGPARRSPAACSRSIAALVEADGAAPGPQSRPKWCG